MLAGLVHDALYQLIQAGLLDPKWKGEADLMFRSLMMLHGSPKIVAQIFYSAVDKFGHRFTRAERDVLSVS